MSWRDPKFTFHGAATHADPAAFARRMKARRRAIEAEAKARTAEQHEKVRPIVRRVARSS